MAEPEISHCDHCGHACLRGTIAGYVNGVQHSIKVLLDGINFLVAHFVDMVVMRNMLIGVLAFAKWVSDSSSIATR
jgi:hypothetical protein